MNDRLTIVGPATSAGRSGVGVLRVSGPEAASLIQVLTNKPPSRPRLAVRRRLVDPRNNQPIDDAIVIWFAAPASFTGEDVVEFQHHGSPIVTAQLLEVLTDWPNVRVAEPGEFTRRAFINGKLDLTAVEGLADLIEATTKEQARQAFRQLEGQLGQLCDSWRARIVAALANVEAEIDFAAEEEVPDDLTVEIVGEIDAVRAEIENFLANSSAGERLRDGVLVAVVGRPNVGKSSLINLLAQRDVAIVTHLPGTTRDILEVQLDLGGFPVTLLDTAGLRETNDTVEKIGVERAKLRSKEADLRITVIDSVKQIGLRPETVKDLLVLNKIDLLAEPGVMNLPDHIIAVSCTNQQGIDELVELLVERVKNLMPTSTGAVITRARHREALHEALQALQDVTPGNDIGLLAEDLRQAANALGQITGVVRVEELLDRIFSKFCIGK